MSAQPTLPARFPLDRPLEADLGSWWVLHTKPNCERLVAAYLMNRKTGYYLPLYEKKIPYGNLGRVRSREVPLFAGYVCVVLDKPEHSLLYDTKKLVRIIPVPNQTAFVRELQAVAQAVESYDDVFIQPGLAVGRRVLIQSGPMAGHEGIVVNRQKEKRLALSVQMFNQSVIVKLDPFTRIEPF